MIPTASRFWMFFLGCHDNEWGYGFLNEGNAPTVMASSLPGELFGLHAFVWRILSGIKGFSGWHGGILRA